MAHSWLFQPPGECPLSGGKRTLFHADRHVCKWPKADISRRRESCL